MSLPRNREDCPDMKKRAFSSSLSGVWVILMVMVPVLGSCSRKTGSQKVEGDSPAVGPAIQEGDEEKIPGGSLSPHGPVGRIDSIPPPKGFEKLDYSFPDTLCGNLVRRLLECETEQLMQREDIKESMRRSLATTKRRRFAQNRTQYLEHCEKTVKRLSAEGVRGCLELACEEMDMCLQKIAGQTEAK